MKVEVPFLNQTVWTTQDVENRTVPSKNAFLFTPEKLGCLLASCNFSSHHRLGTMDNGSRSISHMLEELQVVLGTSRKTSSLFLVKFDLRHDQDATPVPTRAQESSAASRLQDPTGVSSTDVGVWQVSIGNEQHVTIVHAQLRKAWRRLELNMTIDLNAIGAAICNETGTSRTESVRLTELHLQRAMLAFPSSASKAEMFRQWTRSWQEMTAADFIAPDAACEGEGESMVVPLDINALCAGRDELALSRVKGGFLRMV